MTHHLEKRVRYADTDQMGVVYYANYLVWFEEGRTEFFRDRGFPYKEMEEEGAFLPVTEAYCRYRAPARYDDIVVIQTTLARFTPVRMQFDYQITGTDGKLLAEGNTVHGFVNGKGKLIKMNRELTDLWEKMQEICREGD